MKKNTKSTILLIVMSGLILLGYGALKLRGAIRADLRIDKQLDLGTLKFGAAVERSFVIQNNGWRPATITGIDTCCGVSHPYDKLPKVIPGHCRDFITLRIKVANAYEDYEKDIKTRVYENGKNKEAILKVVGRSDKSFRVTPSLMDWGRVIGKKRVEEKLKFHFLDESNHIKKISTSSSALQAELTAGQGRGDYEVHLALDLAEVARGPFSEYLYIRTDLPDHANLIIPVSGTFVRGAALNPEQIFFGLLGPRTNLTRTVEIRVLEPEWQDVKVIKIGEKCLTAAIQKSDKDDRLILNVNLEGAAMPAKINSTITIGNAAGDTIDIPVIAAQIAQDNTPGNNHK